MGAPESCSVCSMLSVVWSEDTMLSQLMCERPSDFECSAFAGLLSPAIALTLVCFALDGIFAELTGPASWCASSGAFKPALRVNYPHVEDAQGRPEEAVGTLESRCLPRVRDLPSRVSGTD